MRTAKEIVAHLKNDTGDFFGFKVEAMLEFLTFEQARPLLKADARGDDWPTPKPLTSDGIIAEMREYMEFAWGKVEDHRGISASRSVQKMESWLYALGDDELLERVKDSDNFPQYGAPALALVCEKYGFPIPAGEAIARMRRGERCEPGCQNGCVR